MINEATQHKRTENGQTSGATACRIPAVSLLPSNILSIALKLFPILPVLLSLSFLFLYFLGPLRNSNLCAFLLGQEFGLEGKGSDDHEYHKDEVRTLAAASRSSFCFCSKDSMDSGSVPGAIVAACPKKQIDDWLVRSVLRKTLRPSLIPSVPERTRN